MLRNLTRCFVALDVGRQHRVQVGVVGKRVAVELAGTQFGRRRLRKNRLGDAFAFAVDRAAQRVHLGLHHVADHGERADHVAVERAVAGRHLAFVAGREHKRVPLVGQRHKQRAANARLEVFLGEIAGGAVEQGAERVVELPEHGRDRHKLKADAQVARKRAAVLNRAGGGVLAWHADANHVFSAKRVGGDDGYKRRVDAAAEADEHSTEAALAHVIADTHGKGAQANGILVGCFARRAQVARLRCRVEEDEVFRTGERACGDLARGVDCKA